MICFKKNYFLIAIAIFLIEFFIAIYIKDGFIRPYFGDFLVVILIYTAVKAFFNFSPYAIALGTLLFAYGVETLQYFNIVDHLGLSGNIIAKTIIGYGFEWWDILAYTLGIVVALAFESVLQSHHPPK
jgi:hypothetical protein